ncbi:MAG TPA: VOC family protein [Bdellovibrio sp.]|uniref:VOC family protein n=1 Tax=Bdellovibrio sp. TaxID=28201 RepID=UPI002EF9AFB1
MQKISPCLWFDNQAEEAVKFYTSLFKNSKIGKTARYSEDAAQASGQKKDSVMTVEFQIAGYQMTALNGGPVFKFSSAVSFFVWCDSESEINGLWEKLSQGGSALMEINKYPWAERYGWCEDRYGVSWQLMLAPNKQKIAPAFLYVNKLFGKGEEAINFYTSVFKDSKIEAIHKDPNTKTVMHSVFDLENTPFVLMEGAGDEHKQVITHGISFIINCKDQKELDYYWDKLGQGGNVEQCGWLTDKFGLAWQIIPAELGEIMSDPKKAGAAMKALLGMKKIDIAKLKEA